MITWITVWVLTVSFNYSTNGYKDTLRSYYQLTYKDKTTCERYLKYQTSGDKRLKGFCTPQQVPIGVSK